VGKGACSVLMVGKSLRAVPTIDDTAGDPRFRGDRFCPLYDLLPDY
jgi:hypothetical protein